MLLLLADSTGELRKQGLLSERKGAVPVIFIPYHLLF